MCSQETFFRLSDREILMVRAIDWSLVKAIATGKCKTISERDPHTGQPRFNDDGSARTIPVLRTFIWTICSVMRMADFDWHAFDPAHPETFVADPAASFAMYAAFNRDADADGTRARFPSFAYPAFPQISHEVSA